MSRRAWLRSTNGSPQPPDASVYEIVTPFSPTTMQQRAFLVEGQVPLLASYQYCTTIDFQFP